MRPLEGYLIIDFGQFLSGPSASLRLADLGARVIKIERPEGGDICRSLYTSNVVMNGDSSVFHAINRNKESFAADLKNPQDRDTIRTLLLKADIVMHNFRPGVMERLGFDYNSVKAIKPDVIYGEISGYGSEGEYKDRPGQDLLLQSLTGLTWLTGNADSGPVAMGLSIVDMLAGAHLAEGILACLYRKAVSGEGGLVQVSMLESAYDFQFETITTFMNDGGENPQRSLTNNANAYLGAPYGIYQTADGYLALAMGSIPVLGKLLGCDALASYADAAVAFEKRDEVKSILGQHLRTDSTQKWLSILEPADIWCADVLNWNQLFEHEGFKVLNMTQKVSMSDGYTYQTTRCPIRIDGELLTSGKGSPKLGQDNQTILTEFSL
ncbi:crotonobetainyl-CoA:carnitine CoA-transferase CaiB-like acyl-CoA transferase [Arcticibacter pallidicorallinus]|uniref:Crotonobetainyl-CoA:carnitine CoA-transferase CaiB-like acyl-CoA transferase n=1 Tax=Arcticibacter pallidicorallinus TaxID=1259464 RepID=A0A2T0U3Y0_9SPHI|nr:CaiB/BaiF CoA-transferase family protein [Arcticibacter pallidicorallinus]PRY52568.1 crotonobetainyl-CoA:carnitine CoA-transferase CaiB-like acyl-CoA transferase [Arcticibacter pallidicorallinus]